MKKEAKIGEDMLKKRVSKQKEQMPEHYDNVNKEAGEVLSSINHTNKDYKARRLAMGDDDALDAPTNLVQEL